MPGQKAAIALLAVLSLIATSVLAADRENRTYRRPFMFFVTPLLPPGGPLRSAAFTQACYEQLRGSLDTTSFQVIIAGRKSKVLAVSNQKRDLILSSDPADYYFKGDEYDTLGMWLKYRVGFKIEPVNIPFPADDQANLPVLVAEAVLQVARTEFLSTVTLEGRPPGMVMRFDRQRFDIIPPRTFLLPVGDYFITSDYPQFARRRDTIHVEVGKVLKKQILLLPGD